MDLLEDTWGAFLKFMPTKEEKERWTSRERKLWVADVLAFHPERHIQSAWLEDRSTYSGIMDTEEVGCNTVGCVAGWACTTRIEEHIESWHDDAQVALALDASEAEELFRASNDRDMLIVALRYSAMTGKDLYSCATDGMIVWLEDAEEPGMWHFHATPDGRATYISEWDGWER